MDGYFTPVTKPRDKVPIDMDLEAVAAALAPRLIAYGVARTGCRSTAEDIAQDALAALVRRWRHAGPPDSPDAFVFAIAKRRAARSAARRAFVTPFTAIRDAIHPAPSAEQSLSDREELTAVRAALRKLTRADRDALLLRIVGDLSFEDIGRVTGSSPAAVKMRISRARRRLAAHLPETQHERRTRLA